MKRVYRHYTLWEDWLNGMWRRESKENEAEYIEKAVAFTGDHELYGDWMLKVIESWPVSCEHNLTFTGMNRRAWIGHAAASMGINSPEYITRIAWGILTKQQQVLANKKADEAIRIWERKNGYASILRLGKRGATPKGYRTKPPANWSQQRLFLLIVGFASHLLGMI